MKKRNEKGEKQMKAYKVFRVKKGRLISLFVNNKACIKYSPKKESTEKTFKCLDGKKVKLPIFAFKSLTSAQKAKKEFDGKSSPCEIWEVEGQKSDKKFYRGAFLAINKGIYYPMFDYNFPRGTIFLSTCVLIRKIE